MRKNEIINTFTFPDKPSSDGYYHLNVKDNTKKSGRTQLKAKTLDELKEKAFMYECGQKNIIRKRFENVFEMTMDSKLKYIKDKAKLASRQNTISRYRNDYIRFIRDTWFSSLFIDEISRRDIERLIDKICKEKDVKPRALQGLCTVLSMTFSFAYREELIPDNPYQKVNLAQFKDVLDDTSDVRERLHSQEEIDGIHEKLMDRQAKHPDYIPAYALEFQMLIKARRGEIPPLMWSDIHDDVSTPFIQISRELITVKKGPVTEKEYFLISDYTKTHRDRRYPVTDDMKRFLEKLRKVHEQYHLNSVYLFPAETPTGTITNNTVYNLYRRICKELSIPISRELMRGPHSFRRNGITDFVNNGGDLMTASQLYGNSPVVARKNYYTGLDMENALRIIEKCNEKKTGQTVII
ncbi:MAG: site-specific integrase [Lachnospiraceae bacterium]|nr:site-specific integrase [Lachnospiraceae bacterium]